MRLAFLLAALCPQEAPPSPLKGPIEYLWLQGAPLAQGDGDLDKPNLSVYLAPAEKANGTAVVICPGGGYVKLSRGHEGHDVAVWLNERGVSAFVLTSRIAPKYRHPCPMLDVQRALRTVRARAAEWKVNPSRIGVLGFSAGGHLAATAVTHFDDGKADAEDPIERASSRPDFGVLCYPVITLDRATSHAGSRDNLLGDKAKDPALLEDLSCDRRVTEKTPPCFMVHTYGDVVVPPENSIDFYLAMRKAKVPVELHLYEQGRHGYGLAPKDPILSSWPDRLAAWMGARGLLGK